MPLLKENVPPVGRFAPSPTGLLHFGSLLTAVGSYCLARKNGGRWLLRIEDLDTPRVSAGAADEIMRMLEKLALHWDGEVIRQSCRTERYVEILTQLEEKKLIFGCVCSRKEVLASAPHVGEEGPIYLGTCRQGIPPGSLPRAWRLRVPPAQITLLDGVCGTVTQALAEEVGDFILRRADGFFAYQLAVVVDDADAGVTQVVRGQDLLFSTPRQIYLQECLGFPHPHYIHLPLALDSRGEKISKRHGAVAVASKGGGFLVWQALKFLGQEIPVDLRKAEPSEVLNWGTTYFDLAKVPKDSRSWPDIIDQ